MKKISVLIIVLGVSWNAFANMQVFDPIRFAAQISVDNVVNDYWGEFNEKFQQGFDRFMNFRQTWLVERTTMDGDSFDLFKDITSLEDLEKFLAGSFLKNDSQAEIWSDLFSRQITLAKRFQGFQEPETVQIDTGDGGIKMDEELLKYKEENLRQEKALMDDLQNQVDFLADMREWENARVDKMKQYVEIALKVTEAEKWKNMVEAVKGQVNAEGKQISPGLMPQPSTPKLKAVGAALELENLYLKTQQLAISRVKLENYIKEKTRDIDKKKRHKVLIDMGIEEEEKNGS